MKGKKDILGPVKEKLAPAFEKVGTLTRVQRFLICLISFAVIGGAYYYFVYMPKSKELSEVQKTYSSMKKTLANYKKAAGKLLFWEQKMADTQKKFNDAMKALPDKRELPSLLTSVSRSGSNAGLAIHLFKPEKEKNKTFYKEIPVSIKVAGRYHQVTDFFYQIVNLNRIVNINNVEVKAEKGGKMIQMACKAVTYMFIEQPPKKPGKNKRNRKRR